VYYPSNTQLKEYVASKNHKAFMADLKRVYKAQTKGGFQNENSLLKLLYVGIKNPRRKWTMPFPSWNLSLSQLVIYFEGRLDAALDL